MSPLFASSALSLSCSSTAAYASSVCDQDHAIVVLQLSVVVCYNQQAGVSRRMKKGTTELVDGPSWFGVDHSGLKLMIEAWAMLEKHAAPTSIGLSRATMQNGAQNAKDGEMLLQFARVPHVAVAWLQILTTAGLGIDSLRSLTCGLLQFGQPCRLLGKGKCLLQSSSGCYISRLTTLGPALITRQCGLVFSTSSD